MGFSQLGPMLHGKDECLDASRKDFTELHWGEGELNKPKPKALAIPMRNQWTWSMTLCLDEPKFTV